jgi:hypothetical protein
MSLPKTGFRGPNLGMLQMQLIALALGAVVLAGIVYGIYTKGYNAGSADVKAEWQEANRLQREKEQKQANTASTKLETGNAEAKVVYRTITKEVDKIVDRPVYVNACFDDDGLRYANAALSGALTPAGKPDARLPKPDAAGESFRGLRPPQAGGSSGNVLRVPETTPSAG